MKISLLAFLLLLFIPLSAQQTVGVFLNDEEAFNGYTLLAPTSSTNTYLVDNCGQLINDWSSDYRPGEVAYLVPGGRLLRVGRFPGSFSGGGIGGRLELFDWSGNLVWSYNHVSLNYHQHHDVEWLPNGNILLFAWESRSRDEAIAAGVNPANIAAEGTWPEQIIEITPLPGGGVDIVWEWHLWDHLVQDFDSTKANYGVVSEHPELFDANFGASRFQTDWIHANAIDYNPFLDQIILNSRNMNEFWIIDHSTTTAEAASHSGGRYGKGGDLLYRWGNPQTYRRGDINDQRLFGQHDAHWIEEGLPGAGQIMVFNNGQGRPGGENYSSIDVLQPPLQNDGNYQISAQEAYGPNTLSWSYVATPPSDFYSGRISGAQRLPNGNTLICEGIEGHVFEVDAMGALHWDYILPISNFGPIEQGSATRPSGLFRAYRYAPDDPILANLNLSPGNVLETNPLPSDCEIFISTAVSPKEFLQVRLLGNPINEQLRIENPAGSLLHYTVYDLMGKLLIEKQSQHINIQENTTHWPPGIYLLHLRNPESQQSVTYKIIRS